MTGGPWTFSWTLEGQITRPSITVVFADCAWNIKNNQSMLETTPFLPPLRISIRRFTAAMPGLGMWPRLIPTWHLKGPSDSAIPIVESC
jgi:hypothetical protein